MLRSFAPFAPFAPFSCYSEAHPGNDRSSFYFVHQVLAQPCMVSECAAAAVHVMTRGARYLVSSRDTVTALYTRYFRRTAAHPQKVSKNRDKTEWTSNAAKYMAILTEDNQRGKHNYVLDLLFVHINKIKHKRCRFVFFIDTASRGVSLKSIT
jgi:hypothetical protein